MRHALVRLTGLLIVLMLVLTGCNLIGVDPILQLDEDMKALKKQYSGAVATYNGGEITQADVMGTFNSQYSYMSQLYSTYGMSLNAEMIGDIEKAVVESAVQNVAIAKQLEARGLKLDDEKLAEVQAEADEHYKEAYDAVYANATGSSEEEKVKRTEYNLYTMGYTQESVYNMELSTANQELIEKTVKDEIAEVTDEQLQAAYDKKLSEDEEAYADSGAGFESDMTSNPDLVCWMPEGYRTVKHILVKPEDDVLQAFTSARSAVTSAENALEDLRSELETASNADKEPESPEEEAQLAEARAPEEVQVDIDAAEANLETLKADLEKAEADCLASVKEKTDEIYAKLEGGEAFDALIEAYGEDPGMQNEPTKTLGYCVSSNSTNWDAAFTAGAMALENVGDVSKTPVVSGSGVHIIRYESDVTPGPVAIEKVHDALYEDTLETMKTEHYSTELESWIKALEPQYNLANFKLD